MRAVNLLPLERRGGMRRPSPVSRLTAQPLLLGSAVAAVAVVGGLGAMTHSVSSTVSSRQAQVRQLDERLAELRKTATVAAPDVQRAAAELSNVRGIAAKRVTWDGFLGAVSRVVPEDVWLLNLSAQVSDAAADATATAAGGAPTAFTITGDTYSQPSVARLMRRLELVPWLKDVSLVTSAKSELNKHVVYQFTIGANFVQLPEVAS